jgi:hypothetical protein
LRSHATVHLVDAHNTTTATFSETTVTLTRNKAGKASLRFLNKTKASQIISGAGKTYTDKAGALTIVALSAGTTTFSLQSNPKATLTVTVK